MLEDVVGLFNTCILPVRAESLKGYQGFAILAGVLYFRFSVHVVVPVAEHRSVSFMIS